MRRSGGTALVALMCGLVCCGCVRRIYLPVESVRVSADTVRVVAVRSDSTVRGDSVVIRMVGDTVVKEAFRLRERTVRTVDTLWRTRADTVRVAVPTQVQRGSDRVGARRAAGWLAAGVLAGMALLLLLRGLIRRLFQKVG